MGPSNACMPVGIQGCADLFLDGDGLCHPRSDRCPSGTIPRFEEGCVEVGIPRSRCADLFVDGDGLCRPRMAKCADRPGTFAVPAEGCVPVDGPDGCGDGRWGAIPEAEGNVYVDPTAAIGGDGSQSAPVRTIAEAMALAASGATIALAAGTYEESATIARPVEIAGRCPSKVRIQGTDGLSAAVRVSGAGGVTLRGLEIGGAGGGVVATDGAAVVLDGVHVRGASGVGVLALGDETSVSILHSLIEDTVDVALPARGGDGARAESGGRITMRSSAVVGSTRYGVLSVLAGSRFDAGSILVEGTQNDANPATSAVLAAEGGTFSLSESAVVGNRGLAMMALQRGASLKATASYIGENRGAARDRRYAVGVHVEGSAQATLEATAIVGNEQVGIQALDPGSVVTGTGDLIANTVPRSSDGTDGIGISVVDGATGTFTSCAVLGNRKFGVIVEGALGQASVAMTGSLVEGTLPEEATGSFGYGVEATDGVRLSMAGSAVTGNRGAGVFGTSGALEVQLGSSVIEGTLPDEAGLLGRGVAAQHIGELAVDASLFSGNRDIAISALEVESSAVRGTLVQDTLAAESTGEFGMGIVSNSPMSLSDTVVRNSRVAGVMLLRSPFDVSRVLVEGVAGGKFTVIVPEETFDGVGDGILALREANVTLTDARVERAARAGILFAASAGVVAGTRSTDNRFGLVIQGSPQPTRGEGNVFDGNLEQDIVSDGDLPVPDAPPATP